MFRLTTARIASKAVARPTIARIPVMAYSDSAVDSKVSQHSLSGGSGSGDSFSKREKAQEEMYVRQAEREKLQALRAKLQKQREHLDELDKHIEEYTREHQSNDKK
ncbi:hypothetical protein BJ508DRAFT_307258 [Ascobolus immersus RN42]|uniref:ATPase inhibitor, mitochondrial n=1 Tax=Ascobolus immersus RN42 TaxID=1160509 RepID=A0A3N4I910_ASCIM|nr:hypothetical protein BJ508DRAFT_307258 [Ascobolus immersus RN42]